MSTKDIRDLDQTELDQDFEAATKRARKRIRKSVPTAGVHRYWLAGWMYLMPDFEKRDHSIIEWVGNGEPAEPATDDESFEVVR